MEHRTHPCFSVRAFGKAPVLQRQHCCDNLRKAGLAKSVWLPHETLVRPLAVLGGNLGTPPSEQAWFRCDAKPPSCPQWFGSPFMPTCPCLRLQDTGTVSPL